MVAVCLLVLAPLAAGAAPAAQASLTGTTIRISRASGPITVDGDLSDPGWRGATRVDRFYEVNPGDDAPPPVASVGYVAYDDRFLYVGFEFADPDPAGIRAPLGDHDHIDSSNTDFGGVLIDGLDTDRTAVEFFVSASNVQYDAISDDASGENSSPDYFWDSATKITARGWTLEMRIPFSSLRYRNADPQTWGIMLWRNYPHGFRYQIASAPIPHGSNCFVCHENRLTGLTRLPGGGHIVAAPYVSGADTASPSNGHLGQPLAGGSATPHAGLDVKFTPSANNAIDATIKPDFSQVESDTAQISANERFALSFPEKRPFFLEGVDLLQTPIQAVYTRTITAPTWGGRLTGKDGGVRYTALVTEDAGGGTVIIPGANGSSTAPQDSASTVVVARAKRDIGLSFVGALVTDREAHDDGGHNRVAGPDFQWRPSGSDAITGQWLFAETRTPDRPDLSDAWTGQELTGSALQMYWNHNTQHLDWYGRYDDVTDGFRADTGFVPQVGYRGASGSTGWTVRPHGPVSRERTFVDVSYQADRSGGLITRQIVPGFGFDTRLSGFVQLRYIDDRSRAGDRVIGRKQFGYIFQFSPSRIVKTIDIEGTAGQDIDFDNARPAHGSTVDLSAVLQPSDHLELALVEDLRRLDVAVPASASARLFTQRVSRVKGTYTFTPRLFVRLIGQYFDTARRPALYLASVDAHSGTFGGSGLFAYKLNWQSVVFVGYGDDRQLSDAGRLERLDRQFFVKLSYAFQR